MYRGANILGSSSIEKVSPSKARENLVEITDKMRFGKKRPVFLLKGGKDIAAIVPIEDKIDIEWLNKPLKMELPIHCMSCWTGLQPASQER